MKIEMCLSVILAFILFIFAIVLIKEDILLMINDYLKQIPKIIKIFIGIVVIALLAFLVVFEIMQINKL